MSKGFTVAELENLKPGATRRELPDGAQSGLYFVIQSSGKKSWAYRYRFAGKSCKLTIGQYPAIGLKDARAKAAAALAKVHSGIDPCEERRGAKIADKRDTSDLLVEKVIAKFLATHCKRSLKAATAYEVRRMLEKELAPWRGKQFNAIGKKDIHALLDAIVDRPAPVTANRVLAWIHKLCVWSVERGLIDINPCTGIKPPAAETARDRVLSDDELVAVWRAAEGLEPPYSAFIKLLILTGARRNEVAEMRWQEIDLTRKVWTLPKERAKNEREHVVPLSDTAVEILRALPRIAGSELVFTLNGINRITAFSLTKDRLDAILSAGLPPWTIHDLRRTFASGCARLGVAVHVVEAALNHRSGSIKGVAAVYNRYSYDTEKRGALDMWARHVEAAVSGESAGNIIELKGRV